MSTPQQETKTYWIKLPKSSDVMPSNITAILASHSGDIKVIIYDEKENAKYLAPRNFWVSPSESLSGELLSLLGEGAVKVV